MIISCLVLRIVMTISKDKIISSLFKYFGLTQAIVMSLLILVTTYEKFSNEKTSQNINFEPLILLLLILTIGIIIYRISLRKGKSLEKDCNLNDKSILFKSFIYFLIITSASIILLTSGWYNLVALNLIIDPNFDNTGILGIFLYMVVPIQLGGIGFYLIGKRLEEKYLYLSYR